MSTKIFDNAIIFDPGSTGRIKQCFAVARRLAMHVNVLDAFSDYKSESHSEGKTLVLSSGSGESVLNSLRLKNTNKGKFFSLQLMDPYEGHAQFDLIVSPIFEYKEHLTRDKNVLNVISLPSNDEDVIEDDKLIAWKNWFHSNERDLTPVFVGGSSQFQKITREDYVELCETLCARAKNSNHDLFFITSPRTSKDFVEIAREACSQHNVKSCYSEWHKQKGADRIVQAVHRELKDIVVTGDSASMISEALYFGRNVTVATHGGFGNPRYAKLHNEFLERNLIVRLTDKMEYIDSQAKGEVPNPLEEIEKEVKAILERRAQLKK